MYNPYWYQTNAVDSVYDYFANGGKGNPLVAMPTGTGKSLVIAFLIRNIFFAFPRQRILMLTHVKKLIEQNAEKLQSVWPTAPLGIYSAGLKSRDMIMPIVFGGVQSVAKAIKRSERDETTTPEYSRHFGWRDIIMIDEAHLLSPEEDTEYQYVIASLKRINPNLKVIGFTATPYRLKMGMITDDGGIFTDICYDLTTLESFNRLVAEGFISPLIAKPTQTKIDLSAVGITGGDYNGKQAEAAVDKDEITFSAVKEMLEYGLNRNAWLVFSAGIDNAEHINAMLQSFGIHSTVVHSKIKDSDKRILDYQNGQYQALVNAKMLTTGFDHPAIDFIADLGPTMSPGLHVQKLGRGTRPSQATQKSNCLVLDFAGNIRRLGPINDPVKPRKPGQGGGDAPVRICDSCGAYNHASARNCCNCGNPFSFETKLFRSSFDDAPMKSDAPIIEYFKVDKILYSLHEKENSPPSIKVSYFSGIRMFNEWICLEHKGMASHKARQWWRSRHHEDPPPTTHIALQRISELRKPATIRVHCNLKFPDILGYEF